jgi:methyltransferase (TIGR00027 family)
MSPAPPAPPAPPALPPVSLTALGVASIRAAESVRADRLFDDPCAAGFVRAASYVRPVPSTEPTEAELAARRGLITWIAVRTRFLDDVLRRASAAGCRQIVILGAGLDSRAFRLEWPEATRLWELDLADVLAFKELVVTSEKWQPRCERKTVPVDLSEDWGRSLVDAGFDPHAPVAWIAEGLLAYLPAEVVDALFRTTAELSVPGSRMGVTLAARSRLDDWRRTHPDGATGRGDYVSLWRSTAPDNPAEWLASFGWDADVYGLAERSGAYGRPLGQDEGRSNNSGLVDATRR